MNKTRIICLVGASGSGKSSVARELEGIGYNVIQSYTTRKPRYENEWGHIFIDGVLSNDNTHIDSNIGKFYRDEMIAYFNSYKSDNHYFATYHEVIGGVTNIYIVDPNGAKQVHEYYSDIDSVEVITIYLQVDEQIRAARMMDRLDDPTFTKLFVDDPTKCPGVWVRLRPDRELFEVVEADYVVNGRGSIVEVTDLVLGIIKSKLN